MDRREDAKLMKFCDPSGSDFSIFNNLGEGLLVEILARLPSSRAATQLKLVCKSWCSLISSQYFITFFNHRRHDASLPPILHDFPHPSSSGCFIFESAINGSSSMVRWGYTQHHDAPGGGGGFHTPADLSFLPCPQRIIMLKASCGDLILCSTPTSYPWTQPIFYYVCNPLTKQWAALPPIIPSRIKFSKIIEMSTGFLCVPAPCSLCSTQCVVGHNNNNNNNFMVVRIFLIPRHNSTVSTHSHSKFKAKLFSSEEGEWKSVVLSSPRAVWIGGRSRYSPTLVPYKGMLHWLIPGFVLVYDPYNCPERFCRVIDMPAEAVYPPTTNRIAWEELRYQTIGLFQDRLRVTDCGFGLKDPVYYVWELEDYKMGKWSLVHKLRPTTSLRLRDNPHHHPHLDPVDNLDPKIKETGFSYIDGSTAFYWTNSLGRWVANGIVHWITDQRWPTPLPPLTACTIQNDENILREFFEKNARKIYFTKNMTKDMINQLIKSVLPRI